MNVKGGCLSMRFVNIVHKIEEVFLALTMVAILLFIFSQAFFRYLFGSGIVWGEEFARYVFIAQIWLGSSLAIKTKGHIRVTFFRNLFNVFGRKFLDLLSTTLFFIFMLFIAFKGSGFVIELVNTGQKSPSMGILMAIPYTVIPFGALLMVIRLIQQFRKILAGEILDEEGDATQ